MPEQWDTLQANITEKQYWRKRIKELKAERDAALDVCRSIVHRHDYPGTGIPEHELYEQALALLAPQQDGEQKPEDKG